MSAPNWMRPMLVSPSNSFLLDEDPGIMSEAETSSTGFRRGSKPRSSLPVVRTPSKTLERPLGLVFLQYRNETKRALLPNEITTLDTVRALFVRSFSQHLSMEYFDSHNLSIYILDPNQDMFYELEDLRDIRDRSILRLYETDALVGSSPAGCFSTSAFPIQQQAFVGGCESGGGIVTNSSASSGIGSPRLTTIEVTSGGSPSPGNFWDPDVSYFSEPEFDSDYRYRHVHKSVKNGSMNNKLPPLLTAVGRDNGGAYYGFGNMRSGMYPSPAMAVPCGNSNSGLVSSTSRAAAAAPGAHQLSQQAAGRPGMHRSFSSTEQHQQTLSLPRNHTLSPGSPSHRGGLYSPYGGEAAERDIFTGPRSPMPPTSTTPSSGVGGPQPPRPPERVFLPPTAAGGAGTSAGYHHLPPSAAAYSTIIVPPPPPPQYGRAPIFDNGFGPAAPPPVFRGGEMPLVDDQTRIRMEQVERQLASLTGLVQTALTGGPSSVQPASRAVENDSAASAKDVPETNGLVGMSDIGLARHLGDVSKTPRLGIKSAKEKCVSFEKSVSFCEDPVDLLEGKHSPQPTESRPTKPAIKSTTLPRASSQALLSKGETGGMSAETFTQLRLLQKRARDLRQEMRNLRRLNLAQSMAVKEAVKDTIQTMKKLFLANSDVITLALSGANNGDPLACGVDASLSQIHRREDNYHREMRRLEKDLSELEVSVEDLRSNVINKKTRVSMADVERLAVLLSQSSKSVAELKTQYPALEESIKGVLTYQMDRLVQEERFLAEEPSKLENTMRRCKKLTSTLVTLRRLASVQEQRQPNLPESKPILAKSQSTPSASDSSSDVTQQPHSSAPQGNQAVADYTFSELQQQQRWQSQQQSVSGTSGSACDPGVIVAASRASSRIGDLSKSSVESSGPAIPPRSGSRYENPFDALLDELKMYSQPSLGDDDESRVMSPGPFPGGDLSSQPPPLQEKNSKSVNKARSSSYAESSVDSIVTTTAPHRTKRAPPPPPPPRTAASFRSSSSFLMAANNSSTPPSSVCSRPGSAVQHHTAKTDQVSLSSRSSSSESINSQEGLNHVPFTSDLGDGGALRSPPSLLDSRHRELLKRQKQLQEQYALLQSNMQQQQTRTNRPMAVMGITALQHNMSTTKKDGEAGCQNDASEEVPGSVVNAEELLPDPLLPQCPTSFDQNPIILSLIQDGNVPETDII